MNPVLQTMRLPVQHPMEYFINEHPGLKTWARDTLPTLPVYAPGSFDHALLKDQVKSAEAALAGLNGPNDFRHAQLLRKEIVRDRAIIAPIRRAPEEALAAILTLAAREDLMAATQPFTTPTVAFVSRLWRKLLFSTSGCWTVITISIEESWEVGLRAKRFQRRLALAPQLPLTLKVLDIGDTNPGFMHNTVLLRDSLLPRCREFIGSTFTFSALARFRPSSFRTVYHLHLTCHRGCHYSDTISLDHALTLTITVVTVLASTNLPILHAPRVHTLEVNAIDGKSDGIELGRLLMMAPNVEHVKLAGLSNSRPEYSLIRALQGVQLGGDDGLPQLINLTSAEFETTAAIWYPLLALLAPNLKDLVFRGDIREVVSQVSEQVSLPRALFHLSVPVVPKITILSRGGGKKTGLMTDEQWAHWTTNFLIAVLLAAPRSLNTLEFQHVSDIRCIGKTIDQLGGKTGKRITSVLFEDGTWAMMPTILIACPNIERIDLRGDPQNSAIFQGKLPSLTSLTLTTSGGLYINNSSTFDSDALGNQPAIAGSWIGWWTQLLAASPNLEKIRLRHSQKWTTEKRPFHASILLHLLANETNGDWWFCPRLRQMELSNIRVCPKDIEEIIIDREGDVSTHDGVSYADCEIEMENCEPSEDLKAIRKRTIERRAGRS